MSRVRFEIIPPIDRGWEPVVVCGNLPELGEWNPNRALRLRWQDGVHVGSVEADLGAPVEFKITRGSWETEAVDAWGNVPQNFRRDVWLDGTISHTVADWKDRYAGRLTRDRVYSRVLAAWRDLLVWLPPSYATASEQRYPVLVFNDGANVFDPETSPLSRVDLAADEWVRLLAASQEMPEAIVVGVCHPEGFAEGMASLREVDLSPELGGAAYAQFLVSELIPEIDARYRTLRAADSRLLAGTGLGATNAVFTVTHHPGVFGRAACLSTDFGVPGVLDWVEMMPGMDDGARWYFDYGSLPPDEKFAEAHRILDNFLLAKGWVEGGPFRIVRVIDGGHDERSWRVRLGDALRFLWKG